MHRDPGRMKPKGDKTKGRTDRELSDREWEILQEGRIDWESLRPKVTDTQTYDKLISVVEESTRKNESLALLKTRLKALGEEVWRMAGEVIDLIK